MNYKEYVHNQTVVHGQIDKPSKYHEAERLAIAELFADIPKGARILDVGCGTGKGMAFLRSLGYRWVTGIELHPEKAKIAKAFSGDAATFKFRTLYNVIYSSHSFEHMYDPEAALENLKWAAALGATFIFILPYPDTGDPKAHLGSFKIGTRVDDEGETVVKWFEDHGLRLVAKKFDDFREPEIWLKFIFEGP